MNIDKQNNHIAFNDAQHKYWNTLTNETYVSVTSLIKKYCNPFDKDNLSRYKAIERIKGNDFENYKRSVGGFKNVVKHYVLNDDIELLCMVQAQILNEWRKNNESAINKGVAVHKQKENHLLNGNSIKIEDVEYYAAKTNNILSVDRAVFPEYLVYLDKYKLAGQLDLVIKNYGYLTIWDYKTTKDIKTENKYNKMLVPLSHLDDCKFNEYQLQLSLYAHFIEQMFGQAVNKLQVLQLKDNGETIVYNCKNLRNEVSLILDIRLKELNKINQFNQEEIFKKGIQAEQELFPS